jgi:glutamyl-tRNA synthetase
VLEWLGIDWDEGPTRQTEHLQVYGEIAERLVSEGSAYRCYCTPEELDAERKQRQAAQLPLIYSGRCRNLTDEQRAAFEAEGRTLAVRILFDPAGETVIEDMVRGVVQWDNALQGDFIILRSDGTPTYQFANPVDDIDAGITHVLRGEDLVGIKTCFVGRVGVQAGAFQPLCFALDMELQFLAQIGLAAGAEEQRAEPAAHNLPDAHVRSSAARGSLATLGAHIVTLIP